MPHLPFPVFVFQFLTIHFDFWILLFGIISFLLELCFGSEILFGFLKCHVLYYLVCLFNRRCDLQNVLCIE